MLRKYPKTVTLKDGREVVLRPLAPGDFDKLLAFFENLAEEDRLFLRHDVRDPELVRKWTEELDLGSVIPVVALDDGEIVANGSLHLMPHTWMQHVGHIRLVTGREHRHKGLGALIASELVALAEKQDLEKIQAHVVEDNAGVVKMLETLGFEKAAVLQGMVRDRAGMTRNLAIMVNDVATLTQTMEDWILESTLPGYRAPGEGE